MTEFMKKKNKIRNIFRNVSFNIKQESIDQYDTSKKLSELSNMNTTHLYSMDQA